MIERVGRWFTLAEMTISEHAARFGINNAPPAGAVDALMALCATVLDPLRAELGRPIHVLSGYRSADVNRAVGSKPTSQHIAGEAADITVPGMAVRDLVERIRVMQLPFDQLIDEFGRWVHVSHARFGPQRGQVMRCYRSDAGRVVYEGI